MEQQYVQQEVPISSDELVATQYQEDRVRNIISQISPDNQLLEIEMRIKGMKFNRQTKKWEKISQSIKEVNEILVSRFISYLSSIMNQNTSLSNLSERQINRIMNLVIEYIVDELDSHSEDYGLENNYTERTRIGHIILNSTFFVLNRALNGQESRRMWKSVSLSEAASPTQTKSGALLEALKFYK